MNKQEREMLIQALQQISGLEHNLDMECKAHNATADVKANLQRQLKEVQGDLDETRKAVIEHFPVGSTLRYLEDDTIVTLSKYHDGQFTLQCEDGEITAGYDFILRRFDRVTKEPAQPNLVTAVKNRYPKGCTLRHRSYPNPTATLDGYNDNRAVIRWSGCKGHELITLWALLEDYDRVTEPAAAPNPQLQSQYDDLIDAVKVEHPEGSTLQCRSNPDATATLVGYCNDLAVITWDNSDRQEMIRYADLLTGFNRVLRT